MTRRPCSGLTLVEVLVTSVVLMALFGTLAVTQQINRSWALSNDAKVQVQEEARRALIALTEELRQAGNVTPNGAGPWVQRLDFQVARRYDAGADAIVWGSDAADGQWIHVALDAGNAQNVRLMRCVTANQADAMPVGFAGCRTLANHVDGSLANTAFLYDAVQRTLTTRLRTLLASAQLPGGSMASSPGPILSRIKLRNP